MIPRGGSLTSLVIPDALSRDIDFILEEKSASAAQFRSHSVCWIPVGETESHCVNSEEGMCGMVYIASQQ